MLRTAAEKNLSVSCCNIDGKTVESSIVQCQRLTEWVDSVKDTAVGWLSHFGTAEMVVESQ
jgi:hypothetical protein